MMFGCGIWTGQQRKWSSHKHR